MKLSVVIPVYNEETTIQEILRRVQAVAVGMEKEIIVVDDGSSDGTGRVLETIGEARITVFRHSHNMGKGAALKTGFAKAGGDIILVQDSDLEYSPEEYPKLLAPILEGKADVVYGSRFLGGRPAGLSRSSRFGNRFLTAMTNLLTGLKLTDMETGYKVFRKEVLRKFDLKSRRFGFEPEVTVQVSRQKIKIQEVPISYSGRDYRQGKKITWRDAVAAVCHLLRFRFFG